MEQSLWMYEYVIVKSLSRARIKSLQLKKKALSERVQYTYQDEIFRMRYP